MTVPDFHLQTSIPAGEPVLREQAPGPCALVIFGATGDLTHRKLVPGLYNLECDGALPECLSVLGFARRPKDRKEFTEELRASVEKFSRRAPVDAAVWERFARRLDYVQGTFDDPARYRALRERLEAEDKTRGTQGNRLYYLSTPPGAFAGVLQRLSAAELVHPADPDGKAPWTRVVIEKPFGRDLESARALNARIADILDERQIFRIDHYLGKETVQNILVFRFGNALFENLWSRKYIDHIQITAAEEIGVEGRGAFYDRNGVLRDIVQNHLLQVLSLCAMEPPVSFKGDDVRDQKLQVLRSLRPVVGAEVSEATVRGQYAGYPSEAGVAARSQTPTFAALRVMVDNWRWQGVPFYLRAGKRLKRRTTEVAITFQAIPLCLFGNDEVCQRVAPNVLILRIQPDEGIALRFATKVPGMDLAVGDVTMDFSYAGAFEKQPLAAYERLLLDAMRGEQTLFERWDAVEQAWRFVTPILEAWETGAEPPRIYARGSSGPAEAGDLLRRDGRAWRPL